MQDDYLAQVAKLIEEQGLDPSDLEAVGQLCKSNQAISNKATTAFVKPPRATRGIEVKALLRDIKSAEGSRKVEYFLYLWGDFSSVKLTDDDGIKISDSELRLKIEEQRKMTPNEKADWDAKCDKEKNGPAKKREYKQTYEKSMPLYAGQEIRISAFDEGFLNEHERPFKKGDLVILRGLFPFEKFLTPDALLAKYGQQWNLPEKGGMISDGQHTLADVYAAMERQVQYNRLVNVGDNGDFGPQYESAADRAERTDLEAKGKMPGWAKDRCIMGFVNPTERDIAKILAVIPLQKPSITPEGAAHRQQVVLDQLEWMKPFIGQRDDGSKSWRSAQGVVKANTYDKAGNPITVKVQISLGEDQVNQFGIVDTRMFGELAPYLLPHSQGLVAGHLWISGSHELPESQLSRNERQPDGTYPMGFAFASYYFSDFMQLDLAKTVLKAGFHVTYECAKEALVKMFGTADLSANPPPEVELNAADKNNVLKLANTRPIINLFESCNNIDDLAKDYQFVMLCNVDNQNEDVLDTIEELKEAAEKSKGKSKKTWQQLMSDLITGAKKVRGWPVKLANKELVYTIFAIRNSAVESALQEKPQITAEEFAHRFVVLRTAQLEEEEKRRRHADDIAALEAMDPSEFDMPKRQKMDE